MQKSHVKLYVFGEINVTLFESRRHEASEVLKTYCMLHTVWIIGYGRYGVVDAIWSP